MSEYVLITPQDLIDQLGVENLTDLEYDEELLQRFIECYQMTKEDLNDRHLKQMLGGFILNETAVNVSDIFTTETSESVPTSPKDISLIAFYRNISTSFDCVYYDFTTLSRYISSEGFLFYNLNNVKPEQLTEQKANDIREQLVALGVLSWNESYESKDQITDPQSMCIAIRFSDGSLFRSSATGILSKCVPETYYQVYSLLFE